ncbi:MAG: RRXRR domain-containing protein [Cyanobacteriota bacterium]|nr:RRXRR domain-containing protein [Cyanobacteriota bacterium]
MQRVPVISSEGIPLMPTKPSRARRWLREGKAVICRSDLKIFVIKLTRQPSGIETQPIAVGVDPGKLYSGIAVQSGHSTLWTGHLILNFKRVKERMETRAMMRRTRRSRRINRKVSFSQRAHRQKRFDNRHGSKLPPSIKSNRQLEIRVVKELAHLYPVTDIVYEIVKAGGSKSFSPVMVGQYWAVSQLSQTAHITTKYGWETAKMRDVLGLTKSREKSKPVLETHAVDGIALAATVFNRRRTTYGFQTKLVSFENATVTCAPFTVVRRPPICRRQLHLLQFTQGGKRRKYGGTTTRHGVRKGDYVEATRAGKTYRGWVSGDTATQVSVSDLDWKRIGQFAARKVRILSRANGLLVKPS